MADDVRRSLGWKEWAAALLVLAVYAICLYRLPTQTFWSPDEGGKYLQVASLTWNGGIEMDLPYAGERLDPGLRFYAYRPWGDWDTFIFPVREADGTMRFHWPLWFTYVAKLPVAAIGPAGGYVVALLAGWLTAILAGLLVREVDAGLVAPAILVVGLATPIWFYSLCFWEHTSAVVLGMAAVYAVVRGEGRTASWLVAAACAVGAVMMRIEMMSFTVALGVVGAGWGLTRVWFRNREGSEGRRSHGSWVWPVVLVVAVALLLVAGMSLTGRHRGVLLSIPERLGRLSRIPGALAGILVAPQWSGELALSEATARAGWLALIVCSLAPLVRRMRLEVMLTVVGLAGFALYSGSVANAPSPYRSLHGVYPIAPFMILGAHGLWVAWERRSAKALLLGAFTVGYLAAGIAGLAMVYVDEGARMSLGLAWGQRYLLLVYPLLSVLGLIGVGAYWRSARPRIVRLAVVSLALVLVAVGVAFEWRGFNESRRTRLTLAEWERALESERVVITDIWWLPAALAELYTRKPILVVDRRGEVAEWIESAPVNRFTFAAIGPIRLGDFDAADRSLMRRSDRFVQGLHLTRVSFAPKPRTGRREPR